jgi:hypothetical protein
LEVICEVGKVVLLVHAYKKVLEVLEAVSLEEDASVWRRRTHTVTLVRILLEERLQMPIPDHNLPTDSKSFQQSHQETPSNRDLPKIGQKGSRLFASFLEVVSQKIFDDYIDDPNLLPSPYKIQATRNHQRMNRMLHGLQVEEQDYNNVWHRHYNRDFGGEVNTSRAPDNFK